MKISIVLKIIACCVISFCLSIFIRSGMDKLVCPCFSYYVAMAQEEEGVSSAKDTPENEVVIHSPVINMEYSETDENEKMKKINTSGDNSVSSDDADTINYDELVKYLEKEKDYLEKLDKKFKTFGGDIEDPEEEPGGNHNIAKDEKDVEDLHGSKKNGIEADQTSQLDANLEEIDNGEEGKIVEDEDIKNDFTGDGNVNYNNPFGTAEVFYEMGKYKEALEAYKSIQKDAPNVKDFVWSQFQIGNCYRNLKEFNNAVKEYQNFINKYPDSFWVDQALWYIEDVKWWKEWNNKVSVNKESPESEAK